VIHRLLGTHIGDELHDELYIFGTCREKRVSPKLLVYLCFCFVIVFLWFVVVTSVSISTYRVEYDGEKS
jgi:hypothetical protein